MSKNRVLFVCAGPGVRARLAEAFLSQFEDFEVKSAQFEDIEGKVPAFIQGLMEEISTDLQIAFPKSVFERHLKKEAFDFVITLCHASAKVVCPVFRTNVDILYGKEAERLSWAIPDFRSLMAIPPDQRMDKAREIRDSIKLEVLTFVKMIKDRALVIKS